MVNVESRGLLGIIISGHLFSVLVYNALQIFWHNDGWWISDYSAHLMADTLEQHAIE